MKTELKITVLATLVMLIAIGVGAQFTQPPTSMIKDRVSFEAAIADDPAYFLTVLEAALFTAGDQALIVQIEDVLAGSLKDVDGWYELQQRRETYVQKYGEESEQVQRLDKVSADYKAELTR